MAWDDEVITLPRFKRGDNITFVLATNAQFVFLSLLKGNIDEGMLDKEMELDKNKLSAKQKRKWMSFCRRVKNGVVIKFLFTKSSV
jgi:hypothetical protein